MLIVSFEEDEEEIFDTVLKVLQENEMIQFQHKCRNKNEIRYINLLIDIGQRIVKKCNQETELTYKEFINCNMQLYENIKTEREYDYNYLDRVKCPRCGDWYYVDDGVCDTCGYPWNE